jgi:hypothetical protein
MNNSDKTIPYRLSVAELENLRILRKKTNPSSCSQDDDEEGRDAGEITIPNSGRQPIKKTAHEKIA